MMTTKAILGTTILALTPLVPALSGNAPEASVRASVHIGIGTPVGVIGFSYDDPHVFGHVHTRPLACVHGPLYYYPTYRVYGHYVPRHRYVRYAEPRYYRYGRPWVARQVHVHGHGPYHDRPRAISHRHDHVHDGHHDGYGPSYGMHGKYGKHGKGHKHKGYKVR